ncbi:MAG: aminotransferase [Gammaproteobacteria bacterium]|nr:MAG: aminotransferase [Gammaproteobacteria bacterium]
MNLDVEFPLDQSVIYLNHAAVAPWPKSTSEAVKQFADENCKTGAQNYLQWLKKERLLREQLRILINAPSIDDIALVKNTSEALSFVAYGLDWQPGDNIVSSNEEFPSNRVVWESLANQGVELRQANLASFSSPEEALFDLIDERTRLLTISSVQFASGLRVDLNKIGRFCKNHGVLFCVDAIQTLGALEFDVQDCQADFVMADGHKWMLGPEGLGVFYSSPNARNQLKLTQFGWHMMENTFDYANKPWKETETARRFECGSPNMLGIHALSASLGLLLDQGLETVQSEVLRRAAHLISRIKQNDMLELLSSDRLEQRSGIVVFKHKTVSTEKLYSALMAKGVICAKRGGGIRFSPHFYTPIEKIDQALKIVISNDIE